MRKRHMLRHGLKFFLAAVIFITLFGFIVMGLWNWLVPDLFGAKPLGFLQAVGLLVLARILVGGMRGFHGGRAHHWRHRMMERWDAMTPEERERFRAGVTAESFRDLGRYGQCGHREPAAPQPSV